MYNCWRPIWKTLNLDDKRGFLQVWGVPGLHDGGVVEGVHEVGVVGQPAHSKYQCYSSKHFNNLKAFSSFY